MQDRDLDVMTICQNPLTEIGNNGGRWCGQGSSSVLEAVSTEMRTTPRRAQTFSSA